MTDDYPQKTAPQSLFRWATLALLLVTGSVSAQEITISAWNIAANAHSITPQIEDNIADGIAMLDSDLVGLTEVKDEDSLNRIAQRLQTTHSLNYDTRFCERSQKLHIGMLVRSGLNVGNSVDVVGTDLNNTRHRQVCAVTASIGEFDFVLGTVHFKSGSGGKKVRVQQANSTAAFFRGATMFGEQRCSGSNDVRGATMFGEQRCSGSNDVRGATMFGEQRCSGSNDVRGATMFGGSEMCFWWGTTTCSPREIQTRSRRSHPPDS